MLSDLLYILIIVKMKKKEAEEVVIGGKFIRKRRLGGGAFGEVFAGNLLYNVGINKETKKEVAIKFVLFLSSIGKHRK
jgi:hypothetical protein